VKSNVALRIKIQLDFSEILRIKIQLDFSKNTCGPSDKDTVGFLVKTNVALRIKIQMDF
jgi:hypothetical protein